MANGNLDIWNQHADINPRFTKPITGKAYKGTSPSPQHVVWCLTDLFGPIGQGWGAHVVAEGFQPLGDELLHWCRIEFWHTDRANTFETYGQTKALMQKRDGGFMSDEDAPKKSFTDALVKAASYVGVAANIFLGRWDDQKYVQSVEGQFREEDQKAQGSEVADRIIKAFNSKSDHKELVALRAHAATTKAIEGMSDDDRKKCEAAYLARYEALKPREGEGEAA